jgi:hypothetical protein
MPFGINIRNVFILIVMAVVGFYVTSYLVAKYGSNP